mmetsp:Transcript_133837/g.298514  ORF Transcript_133837/g.298514 Transcript_133837/m.298514 type:complete len:303 (-) Transcript_133837:11-919(-)
MQAILAAPATVGTSIPDSGSASCSIHIPAAKALMFTSVEHVVVYIKTSGHSKRGDLEVELTSPQGTKSLLVWKANESGVDYTNHKFMTVRHWGEDAVGYWSLTVRDSRDNGVEGTWEAWTLVLLGKCAHDIVGQQCRDISKPSWVQELCTDTCTWPQDGGCDDNGPGADYSGCELGTDCTDCGPRYIDNSSTLDDPHYVTFFDTPDSPFQYTCSSNTGTGLAAWTSTSTATSTTTSTSSSATSSATSTTSKTRTTTPKTTATTATTTIATTTTTVASGTQKCIKIPTTLARELNAAMCERAM